VPVHGQRPSQSSSINSGAPSIDTKNESVLAVGAITRCQSGYTPATGAVNVARKSDGSVGTGVGVGVPTGRTANPKTAHAASTCAANSVMSFGAGSPVVYGRPRTKLAARCSAVGAGPDGSQFGFRKKSQPAHEGIGISVQAFAWQSV
jgi:hypothetical protein